MGKMVSFSRPDGAAAPGYLAEAPALDLQRPPGIVMFQEWWGVDERIKETAARLASHGFNVLVPDVYRGRSAATGDEANHLMDGLDFADAATQDGVGAARYLRELGAEHVGVMGFCMGGALALLSVMHAGAFDAASLWYGFPPPEAGDPGKITVPVQGHWALEDGFFTIGGVDALERKLRDAGVAYEFHRYDAKHGFYNTGEPGHGGLGHHHPGHAETAWQRTVEFFERTLRQPG
jgi:carboxymethylenebutenolidase